MKLGFEKPISLIIYLDIAFVILLSVSGSIPGILSTVIYILAFILPITLGYYGTKDKNNPLDFVSEHRIKKSLPLIAPTLVLVMLLAYITSVIITAITGKTNAVDLGDSLPLAILSHAVLPAIFEEALFRYIPMRALKGEKTLAVIIYTAAIFALIHHSFFSLPYAFFAGAAFMLVDIMTGSIWPSVIIHFLNNLLSVLWYFCSGEAYFLPLLISLLAIALAVSALVIIKGRKYYGAKFKEILSPKGCKFEIPKEAWILIVPMLLAAILELI